MTVANEQEWVLRLLATIETRPGMYLGDERVGTLDTYLSGYCDALRDAGLYDGNPIPPPLPLFYKWLTLRTGSRKNLGWARMVEGVDASDRNVRTFFRLFAEFTAARAQDGDAAIEEAYAKLGLRW
jgi:hypothetical protein